MLWSRPWEGPSPGTVTLRSLKALDTHITSHVRGKSLVCSPIYIPSKQARLGWLGVGSCPAHTHFLPARLAAGRGWWRLLEQVH